VSRDAITHFPWGEAFRIHGEKLSVISIYIYEDYNFVLGLIRRKRLMEKVVGTKGPTK
jgi:hypothetical protein